MSAFNMEEHPHRRFNALTGEWVLVSPHRAKRPWQGQIEKSEQELRPAYDPTCYLCPGNERAGGYNNPDYASTFVFVNDFSALLSDAPEGNENDGELFQAQSESGLCKVICFSPRHDLTIPEMEASAIRNVIDLWVDEYKTLGALPDINYVQIFENKGSMMGCSNPHPHGQIWSSRSVPVEPMKEQVRQKEYFDKNGRALLTDYIAKELQKKDRVIFENDHFVGLVPYWAVWPFEAMLAPKRQVTNLTELTDAEKDSFAAAYKELTTVYDNLFEVSFPYSAGLHQCPTDGASHPEWHMHMHFYPPLLRSATVKKFMVGYEMLANAQRDITPETSAKRLREQSRVHYKHRQ
jgi:UDPglucose--hexose-1-phosphate uridylyltransferase